VLKCRTGFARLALDPQVADNDLAVWGTGGERRTGRLDGDCGSGGTGAQHQNAARAMIAVERHLPGDG